MKTTVDKVGATIVGDHPFATVLYRISIIDVHGESYTDFTTDFEMSLEEFEKLQKTENDLHLECFLVVPVEESEADFEFDGQFYKEIDAEVLTISHMSKE